MEDKLIDTELENSPKDAALEIMRWWERKRLLFNLIILAIAVIAVSEFFLSRSFSVEIIFNRAFILQSLFYFIFINICYCAGWGIQMLGYYYFKIRYDSNVLDYTLFILGTLFTGFITYAGYAEFLY